MNNSNNVMMVYWIDLDTIPPCYHVIEPVWLWLQAKVDLCLEHSDCCTLFTMCCVFINTKLNLKKVYKLTYGVKIVKLLVIIALKNWEDSNIFFNN